MEQFLFNRFQAMIETTVSVGEHRAEVIIQAAETIAAALIAGNKVYSCGDASSALLAEMFSEYLQQGYEIERPGLPAININQLARHHIGPDRFAQNLAVYGESGDILVAISRGNNSLHLIHAVETAIARGMLIILLSAPDDDVLQGALTKDDIHIASGDHDGQLSTLAQFLIVQTLCGLIDRVIFGATE